MKRLAAAGSVLLLLLPGSSAAAALAALRCHLWPATSEQPCCPQPTEDAGATQLSGACECGCVAPPMSRDSSPPAPERALPHVEQGFVAATAAPAGALPPASADPGAWRRLPAPLHPGRPRLPRFSVLLC